MVALCKCFYDLCRSNQSHIIFSLSLTHTHSIIWKSNKETLKTSLMSVCLSFCLYIYLHISIYCIFASVICGSNINNNNKTLEISIYQKKRKSSIYFNDHQTQIKPLFPQKEKKEKKRKDICMYLCTIRMLMKGEWRVHLCVSVCLSGWLPEKKRKEKTLISLLDIRLGICRD